LSLFESHNRDQLRQFYSDAWRKHRAGSPLTALEALIVDVVGVHPEYQTVVADPVKALSAEPESGGTTENPFLHMGLHMAIREQLTIDRPPGVCDLLMRLQARLGDRHEAEHALMEALAEALWEAQRAHRPPDETRYLTLARNRLSALSR
jgi:hypothetical protein